MTLPVEPALPDAAAGDRGGIASPPDDADGPRGPRASHLVPEVAAALVWPVDRRIAFAQRDIWIEHLHVGRALKKLQDVLVHPRTEQMPCMLVAAASRKCKSTALQRFAAENPPRIGDGPPTIQVVVMQMPTKPEETDFWRGVLLSMRVSHRVNAAVVDPHGQAVTNLRTYGSRVLVLDEIHNVLQGTVPEQRAFRPSSRN